ncbi:MAG: hypothetical protein GX365_01905 [Clostridiales bacterium]|nr:hypothetical protein [Clostridiales bacterium]
MQTVYVIQTEMKKVVTSLGFYGCIIITFLVSFTAVLNHNFEKNADESIINVFMNYNKSELLNTTNFSAYIAFEKGGNSWLSMFIPIIAAFSFIPLFCDQRESKSIRYSAFRVNKLSYNSGNFITAFISGGLAVMVGYALFGIAIYFMFPSLSEYSLGMQTDFMEMLKFQSEGLSSAYSKVGMPILVIAQLIEMFLYGAFSAILAFLLASIMRNKYLVLCIPFFLKYMLNQIVVKLYSQAFDNIENPKEILADIATIINPDAMNSIFNQNEYIFRIILLNVILLSLAFFSYNIVMNRRLDCGD